MPKIVAIFGAAEDRMWTDTIRQHVSAALAGLAAEVRVMAPGVNGTAETIAAASAVIFVWSVYAEKSGMARFVSGVLSRWRHGELVLIPIWIDKTFKPHGLGIVNGVPYGPEIGDGLAYDMQNADSLLRRMAEGIPRLLASDDPDNS